MTPAKFSSCLIIDEISIPSAPSMNPLSSSAGSSARWRADEDAEYLQEYRGKNEKPDPRAHQRRNKSFALMDEAQRLKPDDALEADEILRQREAVSVHCLDGSRHVAASSSS